MSGDGKHPVRDIYFKALPEGSANVPGGLIGFPVLDAEPFGFGHRVSECSHYFSELDVHLPSRPVRALVDPAQLESAVLNLAINARDAMPGGGRLALTVSRVHLDDALRELAPRSAA